MALGYRWHSPRGPEYQMGLYDVFSLLNLKDEEEQLKCQVVLKYPRGRSGTYMQFKLEGRDVCASGQLKGKCPFSNLLQMEMSSQLDWPASPRDQVEGKRFGSGSRAASGGGGGGGGGWRHQCCSPLFCPPPTKGQEQEIQSAPPGYQTRPLCSRNKWITQVLTPQCNSMHIY